MYPDENQFEMQEDENIESITLGQAIRDFEELGCPLPCNGDRMNKIRYDTRSSFYNFKNAKHHNNVFWVKISLGWLT